MVSIPYLRVTHANIATVAGTGVLVSIPYLRVTHGTAAICCMSAGLVSIPYLRVTHLSTSNILYLHYVVSIPYLRVTHQSQILDYNVPLEFQSPIYGSRTKEEFEQAVDYLCFNPLSTGHALPAVLIRLLTYLCFNPLSTGHALVELCFPDAFLEVSIPYLRVTHDLHQCQRTAWQGFQSPIYGSRTEGIEEKPVLLEGFNPLSTGHARDSNSHGLLHMGRFNPLSTGHAP